MPSIARVVAFAIVLAGLFASMHSQTSQPNPPASSSSTMPIPVCPPNDPNACHIDQW